MTFTKIVWKNVFTWFSERKKNFLLIFWLNSHWYKNWAWYINFKSKIVIKGSENQDFYKNSFKSFTGYKCSHQKPLLIIKVNFDSLRLQAWFHLTLGMLFNKQAGTNIKCSKILFSVKNIQDIISSSLNHICTQI